MKNTISGILIETRKVRIENRKDISMKQSALKMTGTLLLGLVALCVLISCSENPLSSDLNTQGAQPEALPKEAIQWLTWDSAIASELDQPSSLAKKGNAHQYQNGRGYAAKMITPQHGGIVGGNVTFGNQVMLPPGAVSTNTFISLEVLCGQDNDNIAAVELLPSITFNEDVEVTLSWKYVNWYGDPIEEGLQVFYSDDGGNTWYVVPDPIIDLENRTVTVRVNHFTRYAWGLG